MVIMKKNRKLGRSVAIVDAGMSQFGMSLNVKFLHRQREDLPITYLAFAPVSE